MNLCRATIETNQYEIEYLKRPRAIPDHRLMDEAICAAEYCKEFPLTVINQLAVEAEERYGNASYLGDTLERLDGQAFDERLIQEWIWYSMEEDGFGRDDVKRAIEIMPNWETI